MPTATGKLYGNGLLFLLNGQVIWGTDDVYCALVNSTGDSARNIDTWDYWNDAVANEVTGTNWAANGVAVAGETLSLVGANNDVEFDLNDISVASVTLTGAKALELYTRTPGTDATRELIGYATFDVALAPQGGTLDLDFAGTGFVLIDYT
jgi:hypothetical protein